GGAQGLGTASGGHKRKVCEFFLKRRKNGIMRVWFSGADVAQAPPPTKSHPPRTLGAQALWSAISLLSLSPSKLACGRRQASPRIGQPPHAITHHPNPPGRSPALPAQTV